MPEHLTIDMAKFRSELDRIHTDYTDGGEEMRGKDTALTHALEEVEAALRGALVSAAPTIDVERAAEAVALLVRTTRFGNPRDPRDKADMIRAIRERIVSSSAPPSPSTATDDFWVGETTDQSHRYLVRGKEGVPAHLTHDINEATRFGTKHEAIAVIGSVTVRLLAGDLRATCHRFLVSSAPPREVPARERESLIGRLSLLCAKYSERDAIPSPDEFRALLAAHDAATRAEERERAIDALRAYGAHHAGCALMASRESPCTCGFMGALAATRPLPEHADAREGALRMRAETAETHIINAYRALGHRGPYRHFHDYGPELVSQAAHVEASRKRHLKERDDAMELLKPIAALEIGKPGWILSMEDPWVQAVKAFVGSALLSPEPAPAPSPSAPDKETR